MNFSKIKNFLKIFKKVLTNRKFHDIIHIEDKTKTAERQEVIMKIWYIWGIGLERLEIKANSFDEAIEKARKINKNYSAGQLKE